MRYKVEVSRCQGHARCIAFAPDIYELDDDGYIAKSEGEVPPGQEEVARRGARACPEKAIEIIED